MTRIVVTEFVSLDGVMEEPRWTFDFDRGKEGDQFKYEELFAAESLLLGPGRLAHRRLGRPAAQPHPGPEVSTCRLAKGDSAGNTASKTIA
jgi:hypothetical protein